MVALPLFKLATLLIRHVSKYGATRIKHQAHDHPGFRRFAAHYGQAIHQLNMRMSVALLRDPDAEQKAKEKAEAPTVKTEGQIRKEEEHKLRHGTTGSRAPKQPSKPITLLSIWKRKFRPLPEAKAVDLFAEVIGDAFVLGVAAALVIYEYWKSSSKPDPHAEKIKELSAKVEELEKEREEESRHQEDRIWTLEQALRGFKDPVTKKPLLLPAPTPPALPPPPGS